MTISKAVVIATLGELRVNRPRYLADRHIRSILRRHGGGVTNIGELNPELYQLVYLAAGGAPILPEREPWDQADIAADADVDAPRESTRTRLRTALTVDLEARLKERAGKPRQFPKGRVDFGAPAHFGDQADDEIRDWPRGEKLR